jgi:hypothetical protein
MPDRVDVCPYCQGSYPHQGPTGCVETITLTVRINGTDKNPWHKMGLKCNPFPQIGKAEYDAAELTLAELDGDPVTGPEDIRKRLRGFSPEFVELCVANFRPGERVAFDVTFPAARR